MRGSTFRHGKMGSNIKGMRDSVADPLQDESETAAGPKGGSQVASATPDMQINKSKFAVNPTKGATSHGENYANTTDTHDIDGNPARPANKLSGKNDSGARGKALSMRSKLRRAFGLSMPMQSGNSAGSSTGSKAAKQTPFVTSKGHNLNKFAATKSNTTIKHGGR